MSVFFSLAFLAVLAALIVLGVYRQVRGHLELRRSLDELGESYDRLDKSVNQLVQHLQKKQLPNCGNPATGTATIRPVRATLVDRYDVHLRGIADVETAGDSVLCGVSSPFENAVVSNCLTHATSFRRLTEAWPYEEDDEVRDYVSLLHSPARS